MSAERIGDRLVSRDVTSGELLGDVRIADAEAVGAAVRRARAVQPAWAALGVRERVSWLRRAGDVLLDRAEEVALAVARETGKPRLEALTGEVFPVLDAIRYYARAAPRLLRPRTIRPRTLPHRRSRIERLPRGVVAVIAPWNYPLAIPMWSIVPALAAGNAVVLKPSEKTPLSGLLIAELMRTAGLPDGALQVVPGDGATGAALVEADVNHVSFTGSVATGRRIARSAGERLISVTLELGGKDPSLVLADADLEQAAAGIVWGAFANSGQICASVERVYVVESVADELTQRIVDATRRLRLEAGGHGGNGVEADISSLIDTGQRALVAEQVDDALARGAKLLAGGRAREDLPGCVYEPTLLTDVHPDAQVLCDESFGPVLPIVRVRDVEEAVTLANATPFGLTASVWTRDRRKARELARRLRAGVVLHNDAIAGATAIEAPWGGMGDSGRGRTRGERGLLEFVEEQHLSEEWLHVRRAPFWFPYRTRSYRATLGALPVLYHSRWRGRLRALVRWPRVMKGNDRG